MADASQAVELGANAAAVNALPRARAVELAAPRAYSGLFFDPATGAEAYDDYFVGGYADLVYAGTHVFNP